MAPLGLPHPLSAFSTAVPNPCKGHDDNASYSNLTIPSEMSSAQALVPLATTDGDSRKVSTEANGLDVEQGIAFHYMSLLVYTIRYLEGLFEIDDEV